MTGDRWRRLGELFDQLLAVPPDERSTYLLGACGGDRGLWTELERMLQAHETGGILDQPIGPHATEALREASAGFAPGTWVGPYEIRREIDRGGMGVVYEAHDPRLDRLVALKCLTPALQPGPFAKAQFLAEARAVAALDHPNICAVHDLGDDGDGGLFIAMPFYEGQTLRDRMAGSQLPVEEAAAIARQVASGLECAHHAGIVHRDIKPSNIMVTTRGETKILDFGIALVETDPRGGATVGTPHYMSPEQVRGDRADHRSDLWSLGVVLYEMLAGDRPFTGRDTRTILRAILDTRPPPLGLSRPSIPAELSELVDRLLEKAPDDRLQSAADVRVALAAVQGRLGGGASTADRTGVRGRLPAVLTSFVGRERELASIERLLRVHRLVTLTGPGGTGKTRLATEIARRLGAEFPDGVVFVALGSVSEPALVVSAIAEAAGALLASGAPVLDVLAQALGGRRTLLVLDNLEQVVAGATILPSLLDACPAIRVLATSRIPLRVEGEHQYPVQPLPVPSGAEQAGVHAPADALQLLVDRARAADPGFEPDQAAIAVLAELCRRLDGLPLAIELAAANLRLFPPQQMLARLESRFEVLGRGGRDRPARHRSLHAAIAWSYDLLSAEEQRVFRVLGAFAGGCTLSSADAVCAAAAEARCSVLDAIATLIDHSLLQPVASTAGEPRFAMLESIRAFAAECLERAGEAERARLAHAEHFVALAEVAEPEMVGPQQKAWLDRLDDDHDNIRAAIAWASASGRTDLALRFAAALWRFWLARGHLAEGRSRVEALVAAAPGGSAALRVRALNGLGTLLQSEGHVHAAHDVLEGALRLCREAGDEKGAALVLNNLAWVASELSDLDAAEMRCHEALEANRTVGDTRGIALALNNLGWVSMYRGDFRASHAYHAEGLGLRRRIGDRRGIAFALSNCAWCEAWIGDGGSAARTLSEAMALLHDVSDPLLLGWAQVVEGVRCYLQGALDPAIASLERAEQSWRHGGNRSVLAAALLYLGHAHAARGELGTAAQRLDEALRVYRELGTAWGTAGTLHAMARVALLNGERLAARDLARESLAMHSRMRHRLGVAECLEVLAQVQAKDDSREATRLAAEAARIRHELGAPRSAWRDTLAGADAWRPRGAPS